jgi:hypothetical protein
MLVLVGGVVVGGVDVGSVVLGGNVGVVDGDGAADSVVVGSDVVAGVVTTVGDVGDVGVCVVPPVRWFRSARR